MGQLCANMQKNCGFGGKSTKFGTNEAEYILNDFRYNTKLDFFRDPREPRKSKMAATRIKKSYNCRIFVNIGHRLLNGVSFLMFSDIRNPVEPLIS